MNGGITPLIAGVAAAVIGAVLAFYFGGVREKQKQEYDRRTEEERQREKRESDKARRASAAIDQLRSRVHEIITDVRSLGEKATSYHEKLFPTGFWEKNLSDNEWTARKLLREYDQIVMQRDSIAAQMKDLRRYYMIEATYLPVTTRNVFESFNEEFDRRFLPVSKLIVDYKLRLGFRVSDREHMTASERQVLLSGIFGAFGGAGAFGREITGAQRKSWAEMPKAAKRAREWNPQTYAAAFEEESKRIVDNSL